MGIARQATAFAEIIAVCDVDLRKAEKAKELFGGKVVVYQDYRHLLERKDVDVIVEVGSWGEYALLQERLREKGFHEDMEEGAPLCRWVVEGIRVDVMPTSEEVVGFSNRWYGPAMKAAQTFKPDDQITIRLVTAPYFVATKLEAFIGRGHDDYLASHDIEDLVAVVDGRPELAHEIG